MSGKQSAFVAVLFVYFAMTTGSLVDIINAKFEDTCSPPSDKNFEALCIDLSDGQSETFPADMGLRWEAYTAKGGQCSDQARLRIDPPCWAKSLRIDETSIDSDEWSFNLGDSTSNNGWAGDSNHETYDAEAQIKGGGFTYYKNDHCGSTQFKELASNMSPTHSMTLRVTKFGLERQNTPQVAGDRAKFCGSNCLYDWSTLYLGMNRVVGSSYRNGKGLCRVCLTWEKDNFCKI